MTFTVLSHIKMLIGIAPNIWVTSFKQFYIGENDPICLKKLKIECLILLSATENLIDILNELSEYVMDVNVEISCIAIQAIGKICIKVEQGSDDAIDHILSFLDLNSDHITAECCKVIKNILRKYPERSDDILPHFSEILSGVEDSIGRASVVYLIGEYGHEINDAPYILEPLIDDFNEEESTEVRQELLSAAVKLFFKRPPELQKMLGKVLSMAIEDTTRIDIRDRALLYYRLLKEDVHEAAQIVHGEKLVITEFTEDIDHELEKEIRAEFNTLSIIYGKPSISFIRQIGEESDDDNSEDENDYEYDEKDIEEEVVEEDILAFPTNEQMNIAGTNDNNDNNNNDASVELLA